MTRVTLALALSVLLVSPATAQTPKIDADLAALGIGHVFAARYGRIWLISQTPFAEDVLTVGAAA